MLAAHRHRDRLVPLRIVTLADRPDLQATVADWQWREWGRPHGRTLESFAQEAAATARPGGPEAGFVLLDGDAPVGTACLTLADLDSRPDLSPWLAGVFVEPAHRGRGHATRLVAAVEQAARARGHGTMWLFTWSAVALYQRIGWEAVGTEQQHGSPVTLMRRDLSRAVPQPVADGR